MSIITVSVFLIVYSSLNIGSRCLDILYLMKRFVKKKSVIIPSPIFVGMIKNGAVYGMGSDSDTDDEKQMEEDEEDGEIEHPPDPIDPADERIQVKDEPVENMEISRDLDLSVKDEPVDSDLLPKSGAEDSNPEEFETDSESENIWDRPRPTYEPWDPENSGMSNIYQSFFDLTIFFVMRQGNLETIPTVPLTSVALGWRS